LKKILIVDDEERSRRLVSVTLAGGEYDVLEAPDGAQALDVIRRERPVLVLLDVQMPAVDGIEVCRQVKADPALRGTIVVMLTAQAQAEARRRASAAGADTFLTKPFSPMQLLEIVNRRTAQPGAMDATRLGPGT
jgi:two-component system phosphate regulon response regulator PhoB